MSVWLTMLAAGLITYAMRLSFILLFGRRAISPRLQRALRFVPPAVLAAIIFPELLLQNGQLNLPPDNLRLPAGLLAALVAWRTKNAVLTVLVGMIALWVLQVVR